MKKFFNDNLWWLMIVSLAVGGYALYKIMHKNDDDEVVAAVATE